MAELLPVRIAKNTVFIGGQELPKWIAEDGVVVTPGGHKGFNRVTVTFIVGEVIAEDPQRG